MTKRGAAAAVMVPMEEWRRLRESARPSLKELLLSDHERGDIVVPARGRHERRRPLRMD